MLKKLKVKMTPAPVVKPGEMPVVSVEGDLIQQYINADTQFKAAKSLMDDLRPEILELGQSEIYARSIQDPVNPVTTVKLQDDQQSVVRVQFTSKYGAVADVDAAEELFDGKDGDGDELDINDFIQETVAAKFDCAVFHDEDGKFRQDVYDAFRIAIEKTATKLGVACPLETKRVVTVLPAMHTKRWKAFPSVRDQEQLTRVCPNTVQIVPVTVKVEAKAKTAEAFAGK